MMTTTSPLQMVSLSPSKTVRLPNFFCKSLISNNTLPFTLSQPPFKAVQALAEDDIQRQVDDGGDVVARKRVIGRGDHDAVVVHQIADAEVLDDRGLLDHRDKFIADGGENIFDRLRHHHVAHGLRIRHAARARAFHLALVHRLNARADDLGDVGGGVDRKRDDTRQRPLQIDAEEGSGGIADKVELVVDDVELHEHWRTADDGDIDAGELFQRLKPG